MSPTPSGPSMTILPARDLGQSAAFRNTLGTLVNPTEHRGSLDLGQVDNAWALKSLRDMLTIRVAEEAIAELARSGEARCPCHLGIGQEAVAVGVSAGLTSRDRVFGAHRSHSHY